jgi:hypothetical protein
MSRRAAALARSVATLRAKKAMSDFMSEYLAGREAVNQTTEELKKEGVASEAMATTLTTLTTQSNSKSPLLAILC